MPRLILFVLLMTFSLTQAQERIIFDSDMDGDCDDVAALAVLHALANRNEAQILATVVSTLNPDSPACIDAVNTYFGRPDIPIGAPKGKAPNRKSKYATGIAQAYPNDCGKTDKVPDAVELYRSILKAQPDASVTIVTVGFMTNLSALLKTEGGPDLVKSKVKRWVCMGGNFMGTPPKDDLKLGNVNFVTDAPATLYTIQNWPTKVTFIGREIGSVPSGLKIGKRFDQLPEDHPVRKAYALYFDGIPKDRHVADLTAVLFAVRGKTDLWDVHETGKMDLQADMKFEWIEGPATNESYVLKKRVDGKPNDRQVEKVLEDLVFETVKK